MRILYIVCLFSMLSVSMAQAGAGNPLNAYSTKSDTIGRQDFNYDSPFTRRAGVHLGTQGIGVTGFMPINEQFGVHAGVTFLPVNARYVTAFGNYDTDSDVSARFSNIHAGLDWAPLATSQNFWSRFVVTGGAGYFFKASGDLQTMLDESYYYGDIEIQPEDVGTMDTRIRWKETIAPYLGVGLHNITLNEKLGLSIKLGSYYLSKPSVEITSTGLLEGNEQLAGQIEQNMRNYRFQPVLQVNFSYKF